MLILRVGIFLCFCRETLVIVKYLCYNEITK